MIAKRTLRVDAHREGRWWVFEMPEIEAGGQAASFAELAREAQGAAAAYLDVTPDSIDVDVHVQGLDDALRTWADGEAAEARARAAQAAAAAQKRDAIVTLTQRYGLSAIDAGRVVGISKQRVYQLIGAKGNRERR
ncbi:hypothetical protein SAMN04487783_1452 [Agrococcus baldri]|uniref:Antitoxin HicB n=1 Tax=Agrococcus baldri TaxID=153730 RepID=A0AA94HMB3_9MICO|nr:hypothetical protein [Agrococcus baldri]SFS10726.1 hypothetical protein SAMN04487783_1452 [Agrococcus baldri]